MVTKGKSNSGSFKKGTIPWNKGKKASLATRKKLSKAHQNPSAETRRKMSLAKKGKPSWNKGKKASIKTREKISLAKRNQSAETRQKMSLAKKGRKLSAETRQKMSLAKQNQSAETRKKISLALKGKTPWNKGKKHSAEHVMKIAQANKGKKRSLKTREKQSESHYKILTEEYRMKLSLANKGHVPTKETINKIRLSKQKQSKERKQEIKQKRLKTIEDKYPKGTIPGTPGHEPWHKGKTGVFSNSAIEKIRKRRSEQVLPRKNTVPERQLHTLLKRKKIDFVTHKNFNLGFQWHQVDIFVEPNICIEVDGDFMHANPKPHRKRGSSIMEPGFKADRILFRSSKQTKTAKSVWDNDKKQTKALQKLGNIVLRFWQSEIEHEPEKCIEKILKKIQKMPKLYKPTS